MDLHSATIHYLTAVTGAAPEIRPLTEMTLASLPVHLARAYEFHELQLFGHTVLLALVNGSAPTGLVQLALDREQLAGALDRPVVLVLPQLRAYERQRLLQRQAPFIVPGRQMFLPMLLMDLREAFPGAPRPPAAHLNWVAQALVLRELLWDDVAGRPLARVAALLGYSPMAITLAVTQLQELGLCRSVAAGRIKRIEFTAQGLRQKALPLMRSPVKKRLFLERLDAPGESPFLRAGSMALEDYLDMDLGAPETLAVRDQELRGVLASGKCAACPHAEEARVIVEGWAYPPGVLTPEATVDPFSLYLSMKDDPDPLVQAALNRLMGLPA